MHNAVLQFRANLSRAREHGKLATIITQLTKGAVDISDIWRTQIILSVSALDHFIHEITRVGMVECAKGYRLKTEAYNRFPIPLTAVDLALAGTAYESWLSDAVREKHSWLSFQHPEKIADAIRLISPVSLWEDVGKQLSLSSKDVKVRLQLIVDRRNKIAHEADMDPTAPGTRWPISEIMASEALDFVNNVGEALFKVVL